MLKSRAYQRERVNSQFWVRGTITRNNTYIWKPAAIMVMLSAAFSLLSSVSRAQEWTQCKIDEIQGPHATAVVYRYHAFVGSGRRASIYVDDKKVCSLYSGAYIVIPLAPGEHKLRGSDSQHGVMQQVFKEGFGYYFRVMVQPTSAFQLKNFWVMIPVPPETAHSELKAIKPQPGEVKALPNVAAPVELGAPEVAK